MSNVCCPTPSNVAKAVAAYNRKFAGQEKQVWKLAQSIWQSLRSPQPRLDLLEQFVWEVKKWGKIQGISLRDKTAVAKALLALKNALLQLNSKVFDHTQSTQVVDLVQCLVDNICDQGVNSEHYSWASKILHWLLPDHIPIYDKNVRATLKILCKGRQAYRQIVEWEYPCAYQLKPHSNNIVGSIPPSTLLRGIDKYLWWKASIKTKP